MENTQHEHADNKYVQKVKKVFDENNMDKAENALDKKMDKLMKKGRLEKSCEYAFVKNVIHSKFIADLNHKISPSLRMIFLIIGWIAVISGIIGIFSFLLGLSGIGFAFSFGFGIGLRVIIYLIIAVVYALLSLLSGFGMIKMKKWLPTMALLSFLVSVIAFIWALIPSGFYASVSYGSFGSGLLNLIIAGLLFTIIVKNKELFHK